VPVPDSASALQLVLSGDPTLMAIVRLSLVVSLSAVVFGALIGVPFGAGLALTRFPGREAVIVIVNALMGLPPVVVGLVVYLLLSRAGPLGSWGLLFTPGAMIVAQSILIAPIIAALTRQTVEDLWTEYRDELAAMDVGPLGRIATLIWDGRFSLVTALLAGFGRAAAEVGAEAGQEDGEGERFDQVVVGARVEPGDDVDLVAAGGEDDDEQVGEVRPQVARDVDAVGVGQTEVEQHHVLGGGAGLRQPARARTAPRGAIAVPAQPGVQVPSDGVVVLDDQDAGAVLRPG